MLETATILITAHLAADFPLQPSWMVNRKAEWGILLLHVALGLLVLVALLGAIHWPILLITAISHLGIDALKQRISHGKYWTKHGLFTLDQELHIAVAVMLAMAFPAAASEGYWLSGLPQALVPWYLAGLTALGGLILCVPVGGVFIGMITEPLREQIKPENENPQDSPIDDREEGLNHGGTYIGWLERALVFLFVMIQQPGGIGFLIAAKSILRFGDIQSAHQRRLTEYVIIGTLLSFGWAILFSVLTYAAIHYWI